MQHCVEKYRFLMRLLSAEVPLSVAQVLCERLIPAFCQGRFICVPARTRGDLLRATDMIVISLKFIYGYARTHGRTTEDEWLKSERLGPQIPPFEECKL